MSIRSNFEPIKISKDLTIFSGFDGAGYFYIESRVNFADGAAHGPSRIMILDGEVDRLFAAIDIITTDQDEGFED